MKKTLILVCAIIWAWDIASFAEVVRQNGAGNTISALSIVGTSATCIQAGSDGLSLTVDCSNKRVGIGTTTPATALDVAGGSAQFGSGVHKATMTASGYFLPPAYTLAQIQALTPAAAELGGIITCTNCASAYSICTATGTTVQGFRLGSSGTTACQ